jgi:murein L,D-transpeptidase YcbB/YkuD
MATATATAARISSAIALLMDRLRNVTQTRTDVTDLGGEAYLAPALDDTGSGDPIPDLSATQLVAAMQALAAVSNGLAANTNLYKLALLRAYMTPQDAASRLRTYVREFRDAFEELQDLQADAADAANGSTTLAWLTDELGAERAAQIVAALDAVTAIATTLNAGAGTRRKDLRRAAD